MTTDHIGALLLPSDIIFRIIGRLAFPIYAFLCAEGAAKTSNINKYLTRLAIFAVVSEIPYDLFREGSIFNLWNQNIFFTLFLGVVAVKLYNDTYGFFTVALCAFAAEVMMADYGWYGVVLIFVFYYFRSSKTGQLAAFTTLNLVHYIYLSAFAGSGNAGLQAFSLAAVLPIYIYNGKKGCSFGKMFFYTYYPLHLFVIFCIHLLLER